MFAVKIRCCVCRSQFEAQSPSAKACSQCRSLHRRAREKARLIILLEESKRVDPVILKILEHLKGQYKVSTFFTALMDFGFCSNWLHLGSGPKVRAAYLRWKGGSERSASRSYDRFRARLKDLGMLELQWRRIRKICKLFFKLEEQAKKDFRPR